MSINSKKKEAWRKVGLIENPLGRKLEKFLYWDAK